MVYGAAAQQAGSGMLPPTYSRTAEGFGRPSLFEVWEAVCQVNGQLIGRLSRR